MNKKEQEFVEIVHKHYRRQGRQSLPWRRTRDPYCILISEVMLQQTQVDRVIPKYEAFLKKFPTVRSLAHASLADVLRVWQGLGYNRRAKLLHECAKLIANTHAGKFPKTYAELKALPGIGPYTAGAVLAFAFNRATPIVETNIRTAYLHYFLKKQDKVTDAQITRLVARTLDEKNPRDWYAALMDYGAHIKRIHGNQNVRSTAYTKQSAFKDSDREIRGSILRKLTSCARSLEELYEEFDFNHERIQTQLGALKAEGMIDKRGKYYRLPT